MSSSGGWAPATAQAPAPPAAASSAAATPAAATQTVGAPSANASAPATPGHLGSADVPTALARWQAVLTVAVVVWALLTAALLGNSFDKTRAGAANTEQLTRIHAMESSLFQADALATNAFLVGGLEPVAQRQAYDAALDEVTRLIVISAEAQPADRAALAELNRQVLRYAEQMQQARANNRQGLPVGAQYLREASESLRSDTLPVLQALVDANDQRALGAFGGHQWFLVLLPGIALLLLLGWFNQQLAAVFRRRINVGLAAAAVVVAAVTIGAAGVLGSLASDAASLRTGSFHEAASISAARTAANDAKANESLRLIARGSGAAYEEKWQAADGLVVENLAASDNLPGLWQAYTEGHADIIAADEAGDWDQAVALATSTESDSASVNFTSFDDEAEAQIGMASKAVYSSLQAGSVRAAIGGILALLAAGAAVAAVSMGITTRRREFT